MLGPAKLVTNGGEERSVWIESLRIEGGQLHGFDQRFSRKLNVLIGGRGTGKSSVIELLRFCLGVESHTPASQQTSIEHALGVLGDGRVTVTLTDGRQRVEVTRTAQDVDPQSSDPYPLPFVFSQKEIEDIGLHVHSRLRLVDDFLPRDPNSPQGVRENESRIRSTTSEIASLLSEIDEITEKTAEIKKVQAQLAAIKAQSDGRTKVHKEIEVQRKALAEITPLVASARVKSESIGRASERLGRWARKLDELLDQRPGIEPWPTQAGSVDELSGFRRKEADAFARLRTVVQEMLELTTELEEKRAAVTGQWTGLENRARDVRQKIEEKQKGASAVEKRISDLTQQLSVLNSLMDLRRERQTRVGRLTQQRAKLLERQDAMRHSRTEQREQVAATLSRDLGPSVRVSVIAYSEHQEYLNLLTSALRGSGLRYKELSERIAETYSPQEIAGLAESREIRAIAETLDITEERAVRLCAALRGDAATALFTASAGDDVRIELMDGKDYKEIDFLSMGQRCTAVLPIILRHTERTIVLDQPEDHLDNAFVVETLVRALVGRSDNSQSIIATHNPNIPVLGNADLVLHLDSDGARCFVRDAGPLDASAIVDAVTTIMEGGREAFARRARFYSTHETNALLA